MAYSSLNALVGADDQRYIRKRRHKRRFRGRTPTELGQMVPRTRHQEREKTRGLRTARTPGERSNARLRSQRAAYKELTERIIPTLESQLSQARTELTPLGSGDLFSLTGPSVGDRERQVERIERRLAEAREAAQRIAADIEKRKGR